MDGPVEQFVTFTGADAATAKQYVEMFEGDVQTAVATYLDANIGSVDPFANGPAGGGGDVPFDPTPFQDPLPEEEVRAPIASYDDTLYASTRAGPGSAGDHGVGYGSHYTQQFGVGPGAIPSMPDDSYEELFPLPRDLVFHGTFEDAKDLAAEGDKYVLVNVQDHQEFACHTLNRDVWSSDVIKDIIRAYFVFIQVRHIDAEGQQFRSFYPACTKYPFVGIVEARTGSLVKYLDGSITPERLMEQLTSFLDSQSAPGAANRPDPTATLPAKRESPDSSSIPAAAAAEGEPAPTMAVELAVAPAEPEDGEAGAKIGFRLPDGSRKMRRFHLTNTVEDLLDYVAVEAAGGDKSVNFKLICSHPKRDLADLSETVEAAKLNGGMIIVEKPIED